MSSSRLHKIFNSKLSLKREDIDSYGKTDDKELKNHIEQKSLSSSFEQDALDGWGDLSYDTSIMSNLDKRFVASNNTVWYWIGGVTVACLIIVLTINLSQQTINEPLLSTNELEQNQVTTLMKDQKITVEESDIFIPEPIEKMNAAPLIAQVQVKEIKEDFAEIKSIIDSKVKLKKPTHVDVLDENLNIISTRKTAKEVYLSDLKLIDYRLYRTTPKITTKQVILSGTPANQEGKTSNGISSEWKTIDIPYMEYLEKSVRAFNQGNYKKALSRFETIIGKYPEDVNANFYAGLCLFNFGEYDSAFISFQKCTEGEFINFDEESDWMMALCLEQMGKKRDAEIKFKKIKNENGYYANQASEKLK